MITGTGWAMPTLQHPYQQHNSAQTALPNIYVQKTKSMWQISYYFKTTVKLTFGGPLCLDIQTSPGKPLCQLAEKGTFLATGHSAH